MIFNPENHDNRLENVTLVKEQTNTQTKNLIRMGNKEFIIKLFVRAHHHIKFLEKK